MKREILNFDELEGIKIQFPEEFCHLNVKADQKGNVQYDVEIKSTSEWIKYIDSFKKLNKIELVYKHSKKASNTVSELLCTLICHHGNRENLDPETKEIINSTRSKKNNCPFEMKLQIKQILPEILMINCSNDHNHSVDTAHSNSFLKISDNTLEIIENAFKNKMSPIKIKQKLECNLKFTERLNRSLNPTKSDLYRLYYKWINRNFGEQNGPDMFEKLKQKASEIDGNYFYSGNFLKTVDPLIFL